jgi:hypothetical protein
MEMEQVEAEKNRREKFKAEQQREIQLTNLKR